MLLASFVGLMLGGNKRYTICVHTPLTSNLNIISSVDKDIFIRDSTMTEGMAGRKEVESGD
jgi:hypothetical protein